MFCSSGNVVKNNVVCCCWHGPSPLAGERLHKALSRLDLHPSFRLIISTEKPIVAVFTERLQKNSQQNECWFGTSCRSVAARLATSSSLTSYPLCVLHLVFETLALKTKAFMTHNRKNGTCFRLEKKKSAVMQCDAQKQHAFCF